MLHCYWAQAVLLCNSHRYTHMHMSTHQTHILVFLVFLTFRIDTSIFGNTIDSLLFYVFLLSIKTRISRSGYYWHIDWLCITKKHIFMCNFSAIILEMIVRDCADSQVLQWENRSPYREVRLLRCLSTYRLACLEFFHLVSHEFIYLC